MTPSLPRTVPISRGWDRRCGSTGIAVAVFVLVFGPFLTVIIAKSIRRRGRRRHGAPASRIAGGWDEYVDAAVDAGRGAPHAFTRGELASEYATASGAVLAEAADRAVFSHTTMTADEADEFWRIVESERRLLAREGGAWHRLRATVSLRSFVRHLAPRQGVGSAPPKGRSAASLSGRTHRYDQPRAVEHRGDRHDVAAGSAPHLHLDRDLARRRLPQERRAGVEGLGADPQRRGPVPSRRAVGMARAAVHLPDRRLDRTPRRGAAHQRVVRLRRRDDGPRVLPLPGVGEHRGLRTRALGRTRGRGAPRPCAFDDGGRRAARLRGCASGVRHTRRQLRLPRMADAPQPVERPAAAGGWTPPPGPPQPLAAVPGAVGAARASNREDARPAPVDSVPDGHEAPEAPIASTPAAAASVPDPSPTGEVPAAVPDDRDADDTSYPAPAAAPAACGPRCRGGSRFRRTPGRRRARRRSGRVRRFAVRPPIAHSARALRRRPRRRR